MSPDRLTHDDTNRILTAILDRYATLVIIADESGNITYVGGNDELRTLLFPAGIPKDASIERDVGIGCAKLDEARKSSCLRDLNLTVRTGNSTTQNLSVDIMYKPMDIGNYIITCAYPTDKHASQKSNSIIHTLSTAYESLVENSLQGLIIFQDGKMVFANRKYVETTGFPIDEIPVFSEQDFINTIHPADKGELIKRLKALRSGNIESSHFSFRATRKDGTVWWSDTVISRTTFNDRPALQIVLIDITYKINFETAMMESERKFLTLLGNLPGMAYRCLNTQEWDMELVSDGCEELTGYSPDDLIAGHTIQYGELIYTGDRQYVWDTIQDCVQKGRRFELRYRITTRDNTIKWVVEQGCGVFDDEERIIALEGIIQDITHQKNTEEILVHSERKYRELVEELNDIIFSLDVNGIITYINPAVRDIAGYDPSEMIGRNFTDFIYPDDIGMLMEATRDTLERQIYKPDEYRILTKSGQIRWVRSKSKPSVTDGAVNGLRGVMIDITPLKLAEDEIRKSLDEKTLLLREIHHRVKNNMQIITSLLSLQADKIKNDELKTVFSDSINRIHAMSTIHNMLYDTDNYSEINFTDYLNQITHSILVLYRMHTEIDIAIDAEDVILKLDTAIPCGLIVSELVTNSLKHAFPAGRGQIDISMKHLQNDTILISVIDNGIGMKDSSIDSSASLGIKLVQRLTRQIRGRLETDTSHGTAVKILFPLHNEQKRVL